MHFFSKAMQKRAREKYHAELSMHAAIHGAKVKSLEELDDVGGESEFDENTDKRFEEVALKLLKERQTAHGGR